MRTVHRYHPLLTGSQGTGTTAVGAVGSLTNAVVSAGLLALSAEVTAVGEGTFLVLLLVTAALSAVTLGYLVTVSRQLAVRSYEGIAHALWGRWGERAVLLSLVLGQLGAVFAYFSVLRDTLPWVLQHVVLGCAANEAACPVPWYLTSSAIAAVLTLLLLLPLTWRFTPGLFSKLSVVTLLHFTLFLVLVVSTLAAPDGSRPAPVRPAQWPPTPRVAVTLATLAYATSAHSVALPIFHGIQPRSQKRVRWVIGGAVLLVVLYYTVVALCGARLFGAATQSNLLNNFATSSWMASVVRCSYALEVSTSIPVYAYCLRRNLLSLCTSVVGAPALDQWEARHRAWVGAGTSGLLGMGLLVGLNVPFGPIVAYTGAVAAALNSFVLPSAFVLTLNHRRCDAVVVLLLGLVLGATALVVASGER